MINDELIMLFVEKVTMSCLSADYWFSRPVKRAVPSF